MKIWTKALFKLVSTYLAYADRYRLLYYKYLYGEQLVLGEHIAFGEGSSIVIHPNSEKARLELGSGTIFRSGCGLRLVNDGHLIIGVNNFFNNGCSISCLGSIRIGENNLFGEAVRFYDHNHRFRDLNQDIRNQGFSVGNIVVGNNCWIGSNCIILNNVTIGDNVVIGANSLVNKSIPANTIVKSNPIVDLIDRA